VSGGAEQRPLDDSEGGGVAGQAAGLRRQTAAERVEQRQLVARIFYAQITGKSTQNAEKKRN